VSLASGRLASASGYGAVSFGYNTSASATFSFAQGEYTNASGSQSATFGYLNTSSGRFAFTHGHGVVASLRGQRAFSGGNFGGFGSPQGTAQASEVVIRNSTSNATQTELFLDGSALRITISNDTTWAFECFVVARRTDADNESAAYRITGCIDRNTNAASTALVGIPTVTVISEDAAAWDVDAVADTTNGSLNFRVTGEAAKAIRWVGWVRLTEVTG
jgi:hypothetical protein